MADKNGGFLGGSPQFNKVGAPAPVESTDVASSDTPQPLQPYQIRNAVIVFIVVLMFGALFVMNEIHAGVGHKDLGVHQVQDNAPGKPVVPRDF